MYLYLQDLEFAWVLLQRIDMVPELLSSNLCSLRGNEVR